MSYADLEAAISSISIADSLGGITNQSTPVPSTPLRSTQAALSSSATQPVVINITGANERSGMSPLYPAGANTLGAHGVPEGPMTPRNDVGPFVLDGSAGRANGARPRDETPTSSSTVPTLPSLRMD
jgi:hypothetical protein